MASTVAFGQKTKKVKAENDIPEYKEVFHVLVDSPEVKHGEYVRTFMGRYETSEKGQYRHGEKAGIPILLLYPIWGTIQQFLVIGIVAGNLKISHK